MFAVFSLFSMPSIKVVPLGAGQDVGRSCILISIAGKNIMFDCGMHMGYNDDRRFPDFSYLTNNGGLDAQLDCVIISHFHLDHCGALPHMTEKVGYNGPIYMTHPTKAICPVLLEDYRRVQVDLKGDTNFFNSQDVKNCVKKVISVNLHETVQVDNEMSIKAFYAGHVLGAAMFLVTVGSESVMYTGDFNMTPDRHLGAASVQPGIKPDLLISESTYATTIRDSKRARERDFLKKVHDCVAAGGKVLIPVFALGRAQELCILLESYWERMDLKIPIYFSQGLASKATSYYRLFINWTNEKIKKTFVQRNMFDFKHILPFDMSYVELPGPQVLFATPGMLHSGNSLKVFKKWAHSDKNMLIMPGYCVQVQEINKFMLGTVGHLLIKGERRIADGPNRFIDVKMSIEYMSFSAHADAKGIMQLIRYVQPRNVMFVHGEEEKMKFLKTKVETEFGLDVFMPANGESVEIATPVNMQLDVPNDMIDRAISLDPSPSKKNCPFRACITAETGHNQLKVVPCDELFSELGLKKQSLSFSATINLKSSEPEDKLRPKIVDLCHSAFVNCNVEENNEEFVIDNDVVLKLCHSNGKNVVDLKWPAEKDEKAEKFIGSLNKL